MIVSDWRPEEMITCSALLMYLANGDALRKHDEPVQIPQQIVDHAIALRWLKPTGDTHELTPLGQRQVIAFSKFMDTTFDEYVARGLEIRVARLRAARKRGQDLGAAGVPEKLGHASEDPERLQDGGEAEEPRSGGF